VNINILLEKDEDRIGPDGVETLFKDLDISPASVTALVLAWKLEAGNTLILYLVAPINL
jgi:hypothetical protein